MKPAKKLYQILPILIVVFAAALPVLALERNSASDAALAESDNLASTVDLQPGDYCLSCHTPGDARLEEANLWSGGMEALANNPCPAYLVIQEERYFTDRMLLSIDRLLQQLPAEDVTDSITRRLNNNLQAYAHLLDQPVTSLDAFRTEAGMLRYQLAKVYSQLNDLEERRKAQHVLVGGVAASLVVLVSIGVGLVETGRLSRGNRARRLPNWKLIVGLGLVLGFFVLPIFRIFPAPTTSTTPEEQARQTVLDTSSRAAKMTDRALARAWEFSRLGAAWWSLDPRQSQAALNHALEAADEASALTDALWGEALAAQEASAALETDRSKAGLIIEAVSAVQSRAWALRLIAQEWTTIDPQVAADILEQAESLAEEGIGLYADLDRRGIAAAWALLDPVRARRVADDISDPAIRSWAYREIAVLASQPALFAEAAQAASEVDNPIHRARLLREIGAASGDESYFDLALTALNESGGVTRAYALADLAAASGRADLAGMIDEAYPAARARAYAYGGDVEAARTVAAAIEDPYDRAHAQAMIAVLFDDAGMADDIDVEILRQAALAEIAISTGDSSLIGEGDSPYYQVQVFTALGDLDAAQDAAADLNQTSPLVDLAVAIAADDPDLALEIVDQIDTEADKFEALRQMALIAPSAVSLERLLNLAEAARISGDALSSAEAALRLAATYSETDTANARQALDLAGSIIEGISIKYK